MAEPEARPPDASRVLREDRVVVVDDEKSDWTRRAIDVMTAWTAVGGESRFAADRVAAYAREEPDGALKLTVGFINLAAILLIQLEMVSGSDMPTILQDAAKITL